MFYAAFQVVMSYIFSWLSLCLSESMISVHARHVCILQPPWENTPVGHCSSASSGALPWESGGVRFMHSRSVDLQLISFLLEVEECGLFSGRLHEFEIEFFFFALKDESGKNLYKPLRDNSFQFLLACDFQAFCSSCLDLQKWHLQIWLFENDFVSDFSMRTVPRLQKIWHFGSGVLILFPSSALILNLKLYSSTQSLCCLDWILFLLYLLSQ